MYTFGRYFAIFVELNILVCPLAGFLMQFLLELVVTDCRRVVVTWLWQLFSFGTCVAYIVAAGDIVVPVTQQYFAEGLLAQKWFIMSLSTVSQRPATRPAAIALTLSASPRRCC